MNDWSPEIIDYLASLSMPEHLKALIPFNKPRRDLLQQENYAAQQQSEPREFALSVYLNHLQWAQGLGAQLPYLNDLFSSPSTPAQQQNDLLYTRPL